VTTVPAVLPDVAVRARQSLGSSDAAIYAAVDALLAAHGASGVLADVGCGTGNLWRAVAPRFARCIGVDAVRYDELPGDVEHRQADLDRRALPLTDGEADVVAAIETIEHLENPRAFVRELCRAARPGGLVIVTTPNQLSLLSLLTLARQGPVLRVPGLVVSRAPHGAARGGPAADRGGVPAPGRRDPVHPPWASAAVGRALPAGARAAFPPRAVGQRGDGRPGRMRVTYLSVSDQLGGSEVMLLQTLAEVRRVRPGWSFSVLLPGRGPLAAAAAGLGADVSVVPMPARSPVWASSGRTAR
jgi:SAM-dependent methyltransferase